MFQDCEQEAVNPIINHVTKKYMLSFKVKKCPRNQHFPDLSTGLITEFVFYPPRLNLVRRMPSSWLHIQAAIKHIKTITSPLHLAVSVIP
jgi:hypothetical protein